MGQANLAIVAQQFEKKNKKKYIHPKQYLLYFIEVEGGVIWRHYESNGFYTVVILGASEVAISGLIYRMPKGIMFHVSFETNQFEFFIDKDCIL